MGVKGLQKYLKKRLAATREVLPPGSILAIDGIGYLFDIVRRSVDSQLSLGLGDYQQVDEIIRNELSTLRAVGLNIVVFLDGPNTRFKKDTLEVRREQREIEWDNLLLYLRSPKSIDKNMKFPNCPLLQTQFMETLRGSGIVLFECDDEADESLARFAMNVNAESTNVEVSAETQRCFCYARDSDFCVFKDCPYIEFGELTITRRGVAASHVWRRLQTATALGLSEKQFVDLCILIGNDYTSHFEEIRLLSSPGDTIDARIELLVEVISAIDSDFELSFSDNDLQRAINFSRDLYDLCDLSKYPYDKKQHTEHFISLTNKEKKAIVGVCKDYELSTLTASRVRTLEDYESSAALFEAAGKVEFLSRNDRYILALREMYRRLCNKEKIASRRKLPTFEEYTAIYVFQLVYHECSKVIQLPAPKDVFNIDVAIDCLVQSREMASSEASVSMKPAIVEQIDDVRMRCDTTRQSVGGSKSANREKKPKIPAAESPLPIDGHRSEILRKIEKDQVVIIHGETGCGKSTRLPVFLYDDLKRKKKPCKIIVTQPRRIAALSLWRRVSATMGASVGLRMGHGVQEGNNSDITYMTTGVLITYFTHSGSKIADLTHIIIDEVHERSIENDLACMFVRRCLDMYPNLKIILMSATVHSSLYKDYFGEYGDYGDLRCLSVGVKRYPMQINFVDDIFAQCHQTHKLLRLQRAANIIKQGMEKLNGNDKDILSQQIINAQYSAVEEIVCSLVPPGSGVLVFLSGMSDINAIYENLEKISIQNVVIKMFVIHSDVPLEEQEEAFLPISPNEIKVVLATNAAESSITIPDVDFVICLGTCKSVKYDQEKHKKFLKQSWISKASATQRAGRTGRVRPGVVYRLYPVSLFENWKEHDASAIQETPMQDVILKLKALCENSADSHSVLTILSELIEPPDFENVEKSFEYLFENGMLTGPGDFGDLTPLGKFCSALPVDAKLSRMIAIGIAVGVQREAVILAAALSQQRTLFQIASPFIHKDPDELNAIVVKIVSGAENLDAGCYSEPIMYLRAFIIYESLKPEVRVSWLYRHGLVAARFKSFRSTVLSLLGKVQNIIDRNLAKSRGKKALSIGDHEKDSPSVFKLHLHQIDDHKLNVLRLLLVWSSVENTLELKKGGASTDIAIDTEELQEDHIRKIMPRGIEWKISSPEKPVFQFSAKSSIHGAPIYDVISHLIEAVPVEFLNMTHMSILEEARHIIWVVCQESIPTADLLERGFVLDTEFRSFREDIAFVLFFLSKTFTSDTEEFKNPKKCCYDYALNLTLHAGKKQKVSLLAIGMHVSYAALEQLFFGSVMYGNGSAIDTRTFSSSKRILTFTHEDDQDDVSQTFLAKPRPNASHSCLINDAPLGMRLLSAISNTYRDKKIIFWSNSTSSATNDDKNPRSRAPAIGSKEWKEEREKKAAAAAAADGEDIDDTKFGFKPKGLLSSWRLLFASGSCVVKQPITSIARPLENLPFYAVAYSCVEYHTRQGTINQLEGVTCLPMGTRWLSLALNCAGFSDDTLPHTGTLNNLSRGIQEDESILCKIVSSLLYSQSNQKVEFNEVLVEAISRLFPDWVRYVEPELPLLEDLSLEDRDVLEEVSELPEKSSLSQNVSSSDLHSYQSFNRELHSHASSFYSAFSSTVFDINEQDNFAVESEPSSTVTSIAGGGVKKKNNKSLVPSVLKMQTAKGEKYM